MKTKGRARRAVDFTNNLMDFKVLILGSLGLSTGYITETVGLTKGQVNYRLRKGSVRRADFRSGESPLVRAVVRNTQSQATGYLYQKLKLRPKKAAKQRKRA